MSKHTPGPWVIRGNTVFDITDRVICPVVDMQGEVGSNAQNANGYLIAAAPEMLEAMEFMLKELRLDNDETGLGKQRLIDIIKKARGEK